MTMQTPSGNRPLHLHAAARPNNAPASANQHLRPLPSKAVHERGDGEQTEAECEDVEHRDARLHIEHLVERRDQRRCDRGPLRSEQRETAEIDRDDRKRTEQRRRIAPAQRIVAEGCDRSRDQLFRQRRMHRIEHRLRRREAQHLPRRRHVMHLVEARIFPASPARSAARDAQLGRSRQRSLRFATPLEPQAIHATLWGYFAWQICVTANKKLTQPIALNAFCRNCH